MKLKIKTKYVFNLKKIFGMSFSKLPNTYPDPITTDKISTTRKIHFEATDFYTYAVRQNV